MKTGTIYKIVNNINNKVYIGQTTRTINIRFKEHIKAAYTKHNFKLSKAIRKYNEENFKIEIIVSNVPILFIDSFEKYWINYYNSYKIGYNETLGGYGASGRSSWNKGKTGCYSTLTLKKMSDAKLGITPTNLGQLQTLSKQRTGLKHQNHKLASIYNFTTKEVIAENVSITQWCREHNLSQGNMSNTARGLIKQYKNMYAIYIQKGVTSS